MLGFFFSKMSKIKKNILTIKDQLINESNNLDEIKLMAVSKSQSVDNIYEAYNAGQKIFGENYLQEAIKKIQTINQQDIEWHFIGPIQSNKCKLISENFSWVQSIDRIKIAARINEHRNAMAPMNICIQVNISDEVSKSGIHPDDLKLFLDEMKAFNNLKLRGIMSIPSNTLSTEKLAGEFIMLDKLYKKIKIFHPSVDTLSMGMSNDYLLAVKYGSNLVRIGSGIFGLRK